MSIKTFLDKNYPDDQVVIPAFIDQPDLQHWSQRGFFGVIAAACLTLWFYLFVPLLSLLAWWFGWHRFDHYIIHDYQHGFTQHITALVAVVIMMGLLLLSWASYNILRFYNNERRHNMPDVGIDELATFYELPRAVVQQAKTARFNLLGYDHKGKIVNITFPKLEHHPDHH